MSLESKTTHKKLKGTKNRLVLNSGQEIQYHVPREFRSECVDLSAQLPADVKILEVEIGCGKGEFLAARAARFPSMFFVGIDRRHDRFALTEKKLKRLDGGKNWLILESDARQFSAQGIPELERLHVYHPDPWPKSRHHKHRFLRSPQARQWSERLKLGAEFRFSTDHRGYFDEVLDIVDTWAHLKCEWVYKKEHTHAAPITHFEKIFLSKQEPVFKAQFVRI